MLPMPEPQDQLAASIASEAVEVLEDRLLFRMFIYYPYLCAAACQA